MTDVHDGKVVTFYSYKGGTGRTMALANVAWILAAAGKRVLAVDWDLEGPGLDRYFRAYLDPDSLAVSSGVVDLVRDYQVATPSMEQRPNDWRTKFADVSRNALPLEGPVFAGTGKIKLLSAGRQDRHYGELLADLNWDDFYTRQGGGEFFDALRDDMKRNYDYTLIDSRTGLSDGTDVCTVQLPDVLVVCFTLNRQSMDGAAQVVREMRRYEGRKIRILPVPMRIDLSDRERATTGRERAKQCFPDLPASTTDAERDAYWATVAVPYRASYSYEEKLATLVDPRGATGTLLSAYEHLTAKITGGEVSGLPPHEAGEKARIHRLLGRLPLARA